MKCCGETVVVWKALEILVSTVRKKANQTGKSGRSREFARPLPRFSQFISLNN